MKVKGTTVRHKKEVWPIKVKYMVSSTKKWREEKKFFNSKKDAIEYKISVEKNIVQSDLPAKKKTDPLPNFLKNTKAVLQTQQREQRVRKSTGSSGFFTHQKKKKQSNPERQRKTIKEKQNKKKWREQNIAIFERWRGG